MNRAVALLAAVQLRRRWRMLVLVGLVAGLVGGVVVSSFAGARRTSTAYDRLLAVADFPDAFVQLVEPRAGLADDIGRAPSVAEAVQASFLVGQLGEQRNRLLLPVQSAPVSIADLPVVVGRSADPGEVDEVVVSESLAADVDLSVGDAIPYQALTDSEFADLLRNRWEGTASGPRVDLRIVGVTRSPTDSVLDAFPTLFGTPAFHERFASHASKAAGVWVHLRDDADAETLTAEIEALRGQEDDRINGFQVTDFAGERRTLDEGVQVLVLGLVVFGVVAAVAGVIVVAQRASRVADVGAGDRRVLRDLGLVGRPLLMASALPGLVSVSVASSVTVVMAAMLSRYTPIGVARRVEPTPGTEWNVAFLGVGASAVALATGGIWLVTVWRAGRATRGLRPQGGTPGVPSRLGYAGSSPVTSVAGALAFGNAHRVARRRLAFLGTTAAVTGVVASIVFGASLDRLASEPARWGSVSDHVVEVPDPVREETYAALDEAPEVGAYAEVQVATATVEGRPVDAYRFTLRRGAMEPTLLGGRLPRRLNEIALGPALLDDLGADLDDLVQIDGRTVRVVGSVLTFNLADRSGHTEGAMVTGALDDAESLFTTALVRFAPGVDAVRAAETIYGDLEYHPPQRPADVTNLAALRALPRLLALVLATVGVAALAHTAIWTAGRSGADLAVLRAFGLSRRRAARVVTAASAMVVITSGLAGGAVGVIVGRMTWVAVARSTDLATGALVPPLLVLVVPPAVVGTAWVLGAWSGRRAVRDRPGVMLRAE